MLIDAAGSGPEDVVIEDHNSLSDADFAREFGVPVAEGDEPAVEGAEGQDVEEVQDEDAGDTGSVEGAGEADGGDAGDEAGDDKDGGADAAGDEPEAGGAAKPSAGFRVFDDEGDYDLAGLANLKIEFKGNGKVRAQTLEQLVRTAQNGTLNDERLQKYPELERYAQGLEQRAQAAVEQAEAQSKYALELLEDEDRYLGERERFLELQTPEARATRAEQKLQDVMTSQQRESARAEGQAFASGEVLPSFTALVKEFPEVSAEEIYGNFVLLTAGLVGPSGAVPKENWPQVRRILQGELRERAEATHKSRAAKAEKIASPLKRQAMKAKEEATKVKRTLTRAIKAPGGGPPKAKAQGDRNAVTAEQALDDIVAGMSFS